MLFIYMLSGDQDKTFEWTVTKELATNVIYFVTTFGLLPDVNIVACTYSICA